MFSWSKPIAKLKKCNLRFLLFIFTLPVTPSNIYSNILTNCSPPTCTIVSFFDKHFHAIVSNSANVQILFTEEDKFFTGLSATPIDVEKPKIAQFV